MAASSTHASAGHLGPLGQEPLKQEGDTAVERMGSIFERTVESNDISERAYAGRSASEGDSFSSEVVQEDIRECAGSECIVLERQDTASEGND